MGTGMVLLAHSSHFQICMSVPQIAVFLIRMSTSLWPTAGRSIDVMDSPSAGSSLASARIGCSFELVDEGQTTSDALEGGDRAVDVLQCVRRAHLRADACLSP